MTGAAERRAVPDGPVTILVIAGLAWSLVNFRLDLMRRLRANGHHVLAAAPDFDPQTEAALHAEGIETATVPMQRTGLNPFQDLRTLSALRRLIRDRRPDIVLPYTMKPIVYGGLAARLDGKVVCHPLFTGLGYAFSQDRPRGKRRMVRRFAIWLHRAALKDVRLGFCYNAAELRDLRKYRMVPDAARMELVPGSGVDTRRFAASPFPDGVPVFLFIARMLRSKGLDDLLAAAGQLRAQGCRFRLELLGPADSNPDAIDIAELRNREASGEIVYHPPTRDVRPYLQACHVFVLPTRLREGVPRTILEAMASGRPVITTDAPGCGETITDGKSGYVVPVGDVDALAAAMRRFIDDPALCHQLGGQARAEVCRTHDVHLINRLLLSRMGLEPLAAPTARQMQEAVA